MKIRLLSILWCLLPLSLLAQDPKFRHFEVEDGLPSATVYQVFLDSKGYLWFSTEAGLSQFDGTHFRNYNMDDNLPDSEIFGVFEDSSGRIWVKAYNGKFGYIHNSRIYNESQDTTLKSLRQKHWVENIFENSKGTLFFAQQRDGASILKGRKTFHIPSERFYELLPAQDKNRLFEGTTDVKINILGFREDTIGQTFIIANIGEFLWTEQKIELIQTFPTLFSNMSLQGEHVILKAQVSGDIYARSKSNDFQKIVSQKTLNSNSDLILFNNNRTRNLWIGSLGNGVFSISTYLDDPIATKHYLENKSVSYILKDREGNLWITTLGDGVFMLSNTTVLTYTQKQGLSDIDLYGVTGNQKGQVFVGTGAGKVNVFNEEGNIEKILDVGISGRTYNRVRSIVIDEDQDIWASSDQGIKVFGQAIKPNLKNIKTLVKGKKNNLYAGTSAGLIQIQKDGTLKEIYNKRTNAILPISDKEIWIGANDGLYLYDGLKVTHQGKLNAALNYRILDFAQTSDKTICICTHGNGVVLKKGDAIKVLTKRKNGIVSNVCSDIFVDDNDVIWLSTNGGISRFTLNDLEVEQLTSFTETDNLASNDVRGIYANKGKVWVTTSAGLSYFEETDKNQTERFPPPIYINSIKIWEQDTLVRNHYDLPYDLNNIKIGYTGISFKSGDRIRYRYKMSGIDNDWIETISNEAQYPQLQPGHFIFQVAALNVDGYWSTQPAEIHFQVSPPFWETTWFILSCILLGLAIVGSIVYWIIKNREDKSRLQRQIAESERMALRAQMNPHFVFNALNSIQHFIMMEDERNANYFLSRFSKLMRRVLENSKYSLVNLDSEITTLKLYLELEALRFEGKFEYDFIVAKEVDTYETELPSMIIQPFIENAIWHGLMPKRDGNPELEVKFIQEVEHLVCTIKDNGIGRAASAKINEGNRSEHESTGIANTMRRLLLLSRMENKHASIDITDLKDDAEKALGTLVTIKIPILEVVEID